MATKKANAENIKAEATPVTTGKAVEKVEKAVKKAETAVKKATSEAKTAATKATKATKAAAKSVAKKTVDKVEKAVEKLSTYVEFSGKQISTADIAADIRARYKAEGNKAAIKTLEIYIVPEEHAAYYVINGKAEGLKIEL